MAGVVPLSPIPSQSVIVPAGGQDVQVNVYQKFYGLFVDVYSSDALVVGGVAALNNTLIVRDQYFGFSGDFAFTDTQGSGSSAICMFTGLISGSLLTVTGVMSGTVAVGQFVNDVTGAIAPGTVILSQISGVTGGAGVYTVNIPQTVGVESMSSNICGTSLDPSYTGLGGRFVLVYYSPSDLPTGVY